MFGHLFNDTEVYATLQGLPKKYRSEVWFRYFRRGYLSRF